MGPAASNPKISTLRGGGLKHVTRVVNPMLSMSFPPNGVPGVCGTLMIGNQSATNRRVGIAYRMRRLLKGGQIETMTVDTASNLAEKVRMVSAKTPLDIPINKTALKQVFGMLKRPISGLNPMSAHAASPVRESTPTFVRLSAGLSVFRAKVGIMSLLTPCHHKKGVKLFKKTKMNGAMLVVRLVGGVTGTRKNMSMFNKINRHAQRKGSLCVRVGRSNMVGRRGVTRSGITLICNRVGRPPKTHVEINLATLAVTRCFQSIGRRSMLLFVSGVFHFIRTKSRMSTLLNEVPSTINCRPALDARVNSLRREVASAGRKSVASVRTICMPTSSLASPTPTAAFTRLSTAAMLSEKLTTGNVCPTISPLSSASAVLRPQVINRRRCRATREIGRALRHCGRLRSVVTVLKLSRLSRSSHLAMTETQGVRHFLSRPFFMTRMFANSPKGCINLTRAVENFGLVLSKRLSNLPRRTFCLMNGVSRTATGTAALRA